MQQRTADGDSQPLHLILINMTSSQLKSIRSDEPSGTVMVNATKRTIDLVWIDYQGMEVCFGVLESKKHFGAKTFVGHPWIFFVKDTRLRLNVCVPNQPPTDVLWPQKIQSSGAGTPRYNIAIVVFPVLSLRDSCFQALRDFGVTDEVMRQQCVPDSLKRDYKVFRSHS